MEIKKVYCNQKTKQKLITIPASSPIEEGDFVSIEKVKLESGKEAQLEYIKEHFPDAYKWHMENMEKGK
tara:strand:- start:393 stop:599 length:207 start_codon:yes stop_codon:yes gene_type:complete